MARGKAKFNPPSDGGNSTRGRVLDRLDTNQSDPNEMPQFVGVGKWLREKATGIMHPWNEGMAQRSDLVELVEDDEGMSQDLDHLSNFDASRLPPPQSRI